MKIKKRIDHEPGDLISNHADFQSNENGLKFADNRESSSNQIQLQEIANDSPKSLELKTVQTELDESPVQLKAKDRHQKLFGDTIQMKDNPNRTGLPDKLKGGVEKLSGQNMDDVKVKYNSKEPSKLNAHATAKGNRIDVAPGQKKHLPHEAWHVAQQKQGRVKATTQMKGKVQINDDPKLEREADVMGRKANIQGLGNNSNNQSELENSESGFDKTIAQLAKLNLRTNNTISGVSAFPKRPTSNLRGTQGQHLTAYVVFEDMIRSRVKDRSVPEAAAELIKVLDEILELPGMSLKSADYLKPSITYYQKLLSTNGSDPQVVGNVIDEILSIRNKVPGTAERGTGGGHGEAGNSGILETVETALRTKSWKKEWDEAVVSAQCRESVWRLFDYDPPNPLNDPNRQEIATKVFTHFKSIISAYPHMEKWLNSRKELFFDFLESNRAKAGMPLTKLSGPELKNIIFLVGKMF